jgi:hypothetical protein
MFSSHLEPGLHRLSERFGHRLDSRQRPPPLPVILSRAIENPDVLYVQAWPDGSSLYYYQGQVTMSEEGLPQEAKELLAHIGPMPAAADDLFSSRWH